MATATDRTLADLLERLGGISPARVRLHPSPGDATEQDVLDLDDHEDILCELVDGVLVEKVMGFLESTIAATLIQLLKNFLETHNLGIVAGADGMLRLQPGLVRIPDVSFLSWDRLPNREFPRQAIPPIAPDLAVEVLSDSNTRKEMCIKLRDYFGAGTRLVWYIDPDDRTATTYLDPDHPVVLDEGQTLDGGAVLPGFTVPVRRLFTLPVAP